MGAYSAVCGLTHLDAVVNRHRFPLLWVILAVTRPLNLDLDWRRLRRWGGGEAGRGGRGGGETLERRDEHQSAEGQMLREPGESYEGIQEGVADVPFRPIETLFPKQKKYTRRMPKFAANVFVTIRPFVVRGGHVNALALRGDSTHDVRSRRALRRVLLCVRV